MNDEQATLHRLLDTALDMAPDERERWIHELPDEHAALKPRLLSLLERAARIETSDFLQTLPKIGNAERASAGEIVGPYRLIREVGAGGMGTVWLAERHDGTLKRRVALKFLRASVPHEGLAERLHRERDILAGLVHPGIARLYDAGLSDDGLPYLALEYVDGEHIDRYCRTRTLDVRARVALVVQVARAVAYAHGKLVVHRDLKPANVLVTADGEAHLLDFGIAKLLEDGRAFETRLTQTGGRALTPEYASPEQILGAPVTTASDVYSLGVILYELLTDTRPYVLKRESRGALEDAIVEVEPQAPSERAARPPVARALRGDLDAIVLKALKKAPAERYATMAAFADDLSRYLEGHAVLARPDAKWYRIRKFVGRNRLATGSAAAVLAAVLAGATVALWQARVALAEQQRAEQVKDFIASIFAEANPWRGPEGQPTARELLIRARDRIERLNGVEPETRLELLSIIGESFEGIGATAEAEGVAGPLVERATEKLGEAHPLTLRARRLRAQVFRDQGDTQAMRRELERVLAILNPEANERPVETAGVLKAIGDTQLDEARYADAERTARDAMALMAQHRAAWESLAWEREQAGLWEVIASAREGAVSYGTALEAAERLLAHAHAGYRDQPKHPDVIDARLVFARIAAHVDLPRAIASMEQSVEEAAEVFGAEHRAVGQYSQNLAVWQARAGDLASAAASIERALPILEKTFGPEAAHYAAGLDAAAYIALNSRQARRAVWLYDRALAIAMKHLPPQSEHPTVMRMRRELARAYEGQTASAIAQLQEIRDAFEAGKFSAPSRAYLALGEAQRLAGNHSDALTTQQAGLSLVVEGPSAERERMAFLAEIGLNQVALGRSVDAAESLERALALIEKQQTHVTPLRADVLSGLGRAYTGLGRADEAAAAYAAAADFWRRFDPG